MKSKLWVKLVTIVLCLILPIVFFTGYQNAGKKVVLVIGDWAPYTSTTDKGNGVVSEIVAQACKYGGIDFELKFYPWKRCEDMVKSGQAWATFPYSFAQDRVANYNFSDKMLPDNTVMFYLKTNKKIDVKKIKANDLKTFKDFKIAGIAGYSYEKEFKDAKLNVDWSYGEDDIIHKLMNGRADFIAQNDIYGLAAFKRLYPKRVGEIAIVQQPIRTSSFYLLASKKYPETDAIMKKFNAGLKKVIANKDIDKILKKHNLKK